MYPNNRQNLNQPVSLEVAKRKNIPRGDYQLYYYGKTMHPGNFSVLSHSIYKTCLCTQIYMQYVRKGTVFTIIAETQFEK